MATNDLHHTLATSLDDFIQNGKSFDQEQLNIIPFEGSWTPGQVIQHIILSLSGFVQLVNGPAKDTQRDPHEKIDLIRENFLDFNIKMQSPEVLIPHLKNYDREKQLEKLRQIREALLTATDTLDLEKTCSSFELPFYGYVTRSEALHFTAFHTQRHSRQLKKILEVMPSNSMTK